MPRRRGRGEGGVYQRHDHESCPPVDSETEVRPKHSCRGHWVGTFDITQSGGGRKRKTVYSKTRKEASEKLLKAQREHLAGELGASNVTVEQWVRYWHAHIAGDPDTGVRPSTHRGYESYIDNWIVPMLGKYRLDKLEPAHIRAMYQRMRQPCPKPEPRCRHRPRHDDCKQPTPVCPHTPGHGLKMNSVRQARAILMRALRSAMQEGRVGRNVASRDYMDPPPVSKEHRKPLTLTQARQVLAAAKPSNGDAFQIAMEARYYIALYLGLRQGEVLGLTLGAVHLDEPALYVLPEGALQPQKGKGLVRVDPKSHASVRRIPLPTVLASRLTVVMAHRLAQGAGPDDFLFIRNGKPIDPRWDWGAWADLLVRAGIPHAALHAARNTTSSLLSAAGVPPEIRKEILGHSTIVLTQDVYTMGDEVRHGQAMRALEQLFTDDETATESTRVVQ